MLIYEKMDVLSHENKNKTVHFLISFHLFYHYPEGLGQCNKAVEKYKICKDYIGTNKLSLFAGIIVFIENPNMLQINYLN